MGHFAIKGDCIEEMERLAKKGFMADLIITDPPYELANKNTITFKTRKDMSRDFGSWDYFEAGEDKKTKKPITGTRAYWFFMRNFFRCAKPVLKDGGNLVIFCALEKLQGFISIAERVGFRHKGTLIWHKTNPAPRVRRTGFLNSCEGILWFVNGLEKNTFKFGKQNEMHNFIETPICMGKERTKHETQKPRRVIDRLFKIFSNAGDLVLDPFAGSGTTAESAAAFQCSSVMIENDDRYFPILEARIGRLEPEKVIENSTQI